MVRMMCVPFLHVLLLCCLGVTAAIGRQEGAEGRQLLQAHIQQLKVRSSVGLFMFMFMFMSHLDLHS
jgi:hypothetical protein